MLFPCVRPGPDHAHMAPKLLTHLVTHNYENIEDPFGRKNAFFYKNHFRMDLSNENKPGTVK